MAEAEKIYWDACAWIGLVNGEDGRKGELGNVYELARRGHVQIWTSTMSIVEVNRLETEMQTSRPVPSENISKLDKIFFQPFVSLVAMDIPISVDARRLIRETPGLKKKPDAIHLATAIFWSIPVLHTYDGNDLLHLDGTMKCRDGTELRICEPGDSTDGGFFDRRNKQDST